MNGAPAKLEKNIVTIHCFALYPHSRNGILCASRQARESGLSTKAGKGPSLSDRKVLLDLGDGEAGVQALGAGARAVENGVAAVEGHAVVEGCAALGGALVARVGEPAVGLEEDGGAEVLLGVPPVRGARGGAAGAEDALVEAVELVALLDGLAVFLALVRGLAYCSRSLESRREGAVWDTYVRRGSVA